MFGLIYHKFRMWSSSYEKSRRGFEYIIGNSIKLGCIIMSGTLNPKFAHNAVREYHWAVARTLLCFALRNIRGSESLWDSNIKTQPQAVVFLCWWAIGDSNPGPTGYEPVALTN